MISGVYDLRLVALSVLLAVFAAGTGLDLANSVTAAKGRARHAWLAGGALAMGTGFWSVHVVGALAFSSPGIPIAYDLSTISISLILSIAASAVFLAVISRDRVGVPAGVVAVASLAAAIAGIHYLTMWGMRMPAAIEWRRTLVLGSIALALAASGLALWLALLFRLDRRSSGARLRLSGGVILGAAVVLMHYTAMAAVRLTPVGHRMGVEESDVLATPGLAVAFAGATMLILGIGLTGSVVGRELARRKDLAQENAALYEEAERELARRTEAELAQRESEERFRLLVGSVKDYAIFMLDPDGRVVSWNDGAERIKGYAPDEILGRHFSTFYTDEDRERNHPEHELAIATREGAYQEEGWRVRKDGTRFWASVVITAVHDDEGTPIGFAKVTRDLTERKRSEDERETLLEQERETRLALEEALQVKTDFLATMSHELRTPLNHIIGYADLLLAGTPEPLPEPLQPSVERITGSAHHLLHLIEEIFTYVRLERESDELQIGPVSLSTVVREAVVAVEPLARKKELDVRASPPREDCELETDSRMIQQILANLLENAVTFTSQGEIELRAECTPEAVQIHVCDTGVGIAAEHLDSIFEPFFQVEQGTTRSAEGTGMGLAVARRSAEVLGGEILVRSTPGEGSEFTLRLPRSPHDLTPPAS